MDFCASLSHWFQGEQGVLISPHPAPNQRLIWVNSNAPKGTPDLYCTFPWVRAAQQKLIPKYCFAQIHLSGAPGQTLVMPVLAIPSWDSTWQCQNGIKHTAGSISSRQNTTKAEKAFPAVRFTSWTHHRQVLPWAPLHFNKQTSRSALSFQICHTSHSKLLPRGWCCHKVKSKDGPRHRHSELTCCLCQLPLGHPGNSSTAPRRKWGDLKRCNSSWLPISS